MNTSFSYELTDEQKAEWIEFWKNCRHTHPRQHPDFAEVERALGRTPIYIIGREDGQIKCVAIMSINPLVLKKYFSLEAVCLRGPSFDDIACGQRFISDIISYFKSLRVGRIRLSPYWIFPEAEPIEEALASLGFSGMRCFSGGRSPTGLVDLTARTDEIFASFSSRTRQDIRRSERLSVTIGPATDTEQAKPFFDSLASLHKERSLDIIPDEECYSMFEHVLKKGENGTLLTATCDHAFLGGLLIIKGTHTCHYDRFVVMTEALKKLNNLTIGPALWWRGMLWAKERGCVTCDVEGWEADLPPYHAKYQLCKLKSLFNPKPVQLLGQFQCVTNPTVYSLYQGYQYSLKTLNFTRGFRYRISNILKEYKGKRNGTASRELPSAQQKEKVYER